jgi:hypothetical protein
MFITTSHGLQQYLQKDMLPRIGHHVSVITIKLGIIQHGFIIDAPAAGFVIELMIGIQECEQVMGAQGIAYSRKSGRE